MSHVVRAVLFPAIHDRLLPHKIYDALIKFGFSCGESICTLSVDSNGHSWEDEVLENVNSDTVENMLRQGSSIIVSFHHKYIYITCGFEISSSNPNIWIQWSPKLFSEMPIEFKEELENGFIGAAKEANAAYVLFVPSVEHFEDHFILVEEKRLLNLSYPDGDVILMSNIWVDRSRDIPLPEGVNFLFDCELEKGYVSYVPDIL